jgi:phytoene dehydrogenase-like protein
MEHDYIIIGGGHNGLVASIVLARHGANVLVLEAREELGGQASEGVYRGTRYPRVAYSIGLFPRDLALYIGFDIDEMLLKPNPSWVVVSDGVEYFRWWRDQERLWQEFKSVGAGDSFKEFTRVISEFNRCVKEHKILYTIDPPSLEEAREDLNKCSEGLGDYVLILGIGVLGTSSHPSCGASLSIQRSTQNRGLSHSTLT